MQGTRAAWVSGILVVLCGARGAPATTYYVSPTGNDSGPGTAAQPWLTLQNAANNVQAGDTVDVAAGDYAGFASGFGTPPIVGTANAPITFDAAPGAVIDTSNIYTADGIDLEPGCNYVVIEGFTVQNLAGGSITRAGIRVVNSNYDIVQNNDVNNCGEWGIFTGFANNILIQSNTASNSQVQHGIYVSNASVGPIVCGNTVFGNHDSGIQFNGDLSEGGNGLITNAVVEQNTVYDNGAGGGAAINCDGLQSSVISNNLLYGNHASGIVLYHADAAAGSSNNQVVNNTVINAADSRNAIDISATSTGNTLLNNILFDQNPSSLRAAISITSDSLGGFVSDYNLVDPRFLVDGTSETLSQWQAATGNDTHSTLLSYSGNTLTAGGNDADSTFGGTITDIASPVALDKIGSGTLVLSGTNTYTGGTTVSDGTLVLADSLAIADGTSLTVGAGGTLIFDSLQANPAVADSPFATSPATGIAAVPEPGTLALLVAGLVLAILATGRKREGI